MTGLRPKEALAMLNISNARLHQLLRAGKLLRDADGSINIDSVIKRMTEPKDKGGRPLTRRD